jgi:ketopantoate reductase
VAATDDPASIGPVGIVLFCVKLYDLEAAAALSRPLVGPGTLVLPAQNGVDHVARLGRVFGPDAVLGALPGVAARVDGPGTVYTLGPARLAFGEWGSGASPRTAALLPVFEGAGVAAQLEPGHPPGDVGEVRPGQRQPGRAGPHPVARGASDGLPGDSRPVSRGDGGDGRR